MRRITWVLLMSLLPLLTALPADAQAPAQNLPRKKLIEVGWDQPDTANLRQRHQSMQATTPFDGVTYILKFTADGKTYDENGVLVTTPWKRAWLDGVLADIKACKFTQFTDNFIRVNCTPGELRWDSDRDWATASLNLAQVAWFAKQTGTRGICFDPESYGKPQFQWNRDGRMSWEQTERLARRRGAEVMRAMAKEYPDMTFLAMWLFSLNNSAARSANPTPALKKDKYGLWPAFVNGLLDAAPATMRLVDASENGYYVDNKAGYLEMYNLIRNTSGPLMRLVAPENRERYARQVTAGFGFYLDRYVNNPTDQYYIAPLPGQTPLERLQTNLAGAMSVSDEYVWAYGEQSRWWDPPYSPDFFKDYLPTSNGKGRLWEEAFPGITEALHLARDPSRLVRDVLPRRTPALNRAVNGGFDSPATDAGSIPGFEQWQDDGSKGTFTLDTKTGQARLTGIAEGCLLQKHPARPGERFLVEAEVGDDSADSAYVMVRWQTDDGKWVRWDDDSVLAMESQPGKPRIARGVVIVPEGAGQLVVLLGASHQRVGESCWFDNLGVYRWADLSK